MSSKKEWDEFFEGTGYKLVKRNYFWKIFAVRVFLVSIFSFYYALSENLFDGIIQVEVKPNFENNVTIENDYDFKSEVNNEYKHTIENNHTIYNNNFVEGLE